MRSGELKVLHVTEAVGAGVESAITQYVRSTPEMQHTILISGDRPERIGGNHDLSWAHTGGLAGLAWALQRRASSYDVIHLHSSLAGAIGRTVMLPSRTPVVYSPHALAHLNDARKLRSMFKAIEQVLQRHTSAFGAVSQHEADALMAIGVGAGRIVVVPHAIKPPDAPSSFETRGTSVIGVGRLSVQKDPWMFAEVASLARRTDSQSQWRWVGDGDDNARAALEQTGVVVTGWLDASAAHAEMQQARALLHTARYEGLPIALVEALAAGTPVVARDIPALRNLPVRLFESPQQMLGALESLQDREEWTAASLEGVSHVRATFTGHAQAAALRELYAKAVNR
nr:glycosyltransferase [uncultured Nocardioides sp.]